MRVTNRMLVDRSLARLQQQQQGLARQQERVSSGRDIRRVSDDPSGATRVLALQSDLRAREQEARNAQDARTLLDLSDSALQSVVQRMHRARDLVVSGANVTSDEAREAMALEVAAIRDEVVGVANTRHAGRPLFSGFADADAVSGGPGAWGYGGDAGAVRRRIGPGDEVVVNVTADEVFGFSAGSDLFSLLDDVEANLQAGDQAALSASLADLDDALARIGDAQARIGSAGNRVEAAQARNLDAQLAVRTEQAQLQDADLSEAIMELQLQEMGYQATLSTLGRVLPDSLMSFLR